MYWKDTFFVLRNTNQIQWFHVKILFLNGKCKTLCLHFLGHISDFWRHRSSRFHSVFVIFGGWVFEEGALLKISIRKRESTVHSPRMKVCRKSCFENQETQRRKMFYVRACELIYVGWRKICLKIVFFSLKNFLLEFSFSLIPSGKEKSSFESSQNPTKTIKTFLKTIMKFSSL